MKSVANNSTGYDGRKHLTERSSKLNAAWQSILLTVILIAAKLIIGLRTGSLAILSQATDSGFDLIALAVTILAVRISAVPPDDDHLYGHGKFENLSALGQALLLLGITIFIGVEAVGRLLSVDIRHVDVNVWSFGVLMFSIVIDAWRTRMLHRAGKEHNSQALEASALNFMTDMLSGAVALVGLIVVRFLHYDNADAWAALVVSGFVAIMSIRLGKKAIDGLTDRFAERAEYQGLREDVESTEGVESVRRLRVRQAGPYYFIEVTIEIDRMLPYAAIEKILKEVEGRIRRKFDSSDVTVHWHPVRTGTESPFETLKLVTSEYGVLPHNVELTQNAIGDIFLDYHLEFPPQTALVAAHELSKKIESRVMQELPQVTRVTSHLEEERSDLVPATVLDVTARESRLVQELEFYAKATNRTVAAVRDIRITELMDSHAMKLVLTLDLDPTISLSNAHDVATNVEEEIRKRFPELRRILIHVNPVIAAS